MLSSSDEKEQKNYFHTYPRQVYVPNDMDDEDVARCAIFRSRHRFPALSYYHQGSGTSIWRASQNQTGIFNKRSEYDEKMLRCIGETNEYTDQVLIVDARSKVSAQCNRVKGGGYEYEEYYTNCNMYFGGIDNIHGVRDAYRRWYPTWQEQWYSRNYDEIISKINTQKWRELVQTILKTACHISNTMFLDHKCVLVHCSDGWDRTAQLCSLTQIMLDPFYRTLKGLEVVIEKEWISFGYQFDKRSGNFQDEGHEADERSPVFIQFLDWVYQLVEQFPTVFQYNSNLLQFLAVNIYSCKFGSFIMDNQWLRDKFQDKLSENSTSIWTYVNDHCAEFLNPFYSPIPHRIEPNCDITSIMFWKEHFLAWAEVHHKEVIHDTVQPFDNREEVFIAYINERDRIENKLREQITP